MSRLLSRGIELVAHLGEFMKRKAKERDGMVRLIKAAIARHWDMQDGIDVDLGYALEVKTERLVATIKQVVSQMRLFDTEEAAQEGKGT